MSSSMKRIYVRHVVDEKDGGDDEGGGGKTFTKVIIFEAIPDGVAGAGARQDGIPRTFDGVLKACCGKYGLDYDDLVDSGSTPALFEYNREHDIYAHVETLYELLDQGLYHFQIIRHPSSSTASSRSKKEKESSTSTRKRPKPSPSSSRPPASTSVSRTPRASSGGSRSSSSRPQRNRSAPEFFGATTCDVRDSDDKASNITAASPSPRKKTKKSTATKTTKTSTTTLTVSRSSKDTLQSLCDETARLRGLCLNDEWKEVLKMLKRNNKLATVPLTTGSGGKTSVLLIAFNRMSMSADAMTTIDYLLTNLPAAASMKNICGCLPLLTILSRARNIQLPDGGRLTLIERVLDAYPDAIKVKGGPYLRLPLHYAGSGTVLYSRKSCMSSVPWMKWC